MVQANPALRHLPVVSALPSSTKPAGYLNRRCDALPCFGCPEHTTTVCTLILSFHKINALPRRPHSPKSAIRIVYAFRKVKLVFFVPFQTPGSCNLVCSYAPFPSSFGPRNPSAVFLSTRDLVRWNSGVVSELPCHKPPANELEPCNGRWCRSHRHTVADPRVQIKRKTCIRFSSNFRSPEIRVSMRICGDTSISEQS